LPLSSSPGSPPPPTHMIDIDTMDTNWQTVYFVNMCKYVWCFVINVTPIFVNDANVIFGPCNFP
jgi:hypothetical protein